MTTCKDCKPVVPNMSDSQTWDGHIELCAVHILADEYAERNYAQVHEIESLRQQLADIERLLSHYISADSKRADSLRIDSQRKELT